MGQYRYIKIRYCSKEYTSFIGVDPDSPKELGKDILGYDPVCTDCRIRGSKVKYPDPQLRVTVREIYDSGPCQGIVEVIATCPKTRCTSHTKRKSS